jgi:DNA-binding HxlR family transcriptional regulator
MNMKCPYCHKESDMVSFRGKQVLNFIEKSETPVRWSEIKKHFNYTHDNILKRVLDKLIREEKIKKREKKYEKSP